MTIAFAVSFKLVKFLTFVFAVILGHQYQHDGLSHQCDGSLITDE